MLRSGSISILRRGRWRNLCPQNFAHEKRQSQGATGVRRMISPSGELEEVGDHFLLLAELCFGFLDLLLAELVDIESFDNG